MDLRIQRLATVRSHITNHFVNFQKKGAGKMTYELAETRVQSLAEEWQKFINYDEELRESVDVDYGHQYFTEDWMYVVQEAFEDVRDLYIQFMKTHKPQLPPPARESTSRSTGQQGNEGISSLLRNLPQISLPTFSGNSSDWPHFRDMFTTLVDSQKVPAVIKLNYLHTTLQGEALDLIKNIPISEKNYETTWNTLKNFYENERRLVNHYLNQMFSVKPMVSESYSEVKRILLEVFSPFDALTALGRHTPYWADIVVFTIVKLMDKETRRDWEKQLGKTSTPPSLDRVKTFLENQALIYEAVHKSCEDASQTPPKSKKSSSNTSLQTSVEDTKKKDSQKKKNKTKKKLCPCCKSEHTLHKCSTFKEKPVSERRAFITQQKLCFNCFGPHQSDACKSNFKCFSCDGKHHTLLHYSKGESSKTAPQVAENNSTKTTSVHKNNQNTQTQTVQSSSTSEDQSSGFLTYNCGATQYGNGQAGVILGTARIIVEGPDGRRVSARALIDNCSQPSFISEKLFRKLELPSSSCNTSVSAVGGIKTVSALESTRFTIRPHFNSKFSCPVKALVVPRVCNYLPPQIQKTTNLLHLTGLNLADPAFLDKTEIEVLLGADIHALIIQESIIRGQPDEPIATSSLLGWLISGSIPLNSHVSNFVSMHCSQSSSDDSLSDILQRFWRQEELPTSKLLTPDEEACEKHFVENFGRDDKGRYILKLPFKTSGDIRLGDSYAKAVAMLKKLEASFQKDPEFKKLYFDFITEYISSGHMRPVLEGSDQFRPLDQSYFLPHHGVLKPSSTTTKLRTVFNGSSKTTQKISLNDLLHVGPNLLPELPDLICAWRLYKYVFICDIKQMFRQIRVHEDDQPYQAIVWRFNPNDPIQTYHLTTVTYGLACSPYLATRTLRQLASDHQSNYPLASEIVTKECYMDDMLSGGHTEEQALDKRNQLIELLKEGGFELRKWLSNDPKLLSQLPQDHLAIEPAANFEASTSFAVLGLNWHAKDDYFTFIMNFEPISGEISKRTVLSKVAQIFDPMGWIAPVTISAKIFMQSLWLLKCDWDDPLPLAYATAWKDWTGKLIAMPPLKIPRFVNFTPDFISCEIHGFADASEKAVSATMYLRVLEKDRVSCSLQLAKTKVAPLKTLSIPRLELLGAFTLSKLVNNYVSSIPIKINAIHLWSDSKDVLFWLRSHPSRWKTFVANRCASIHSLVPTACWHYVKSAENPADIASRGIDPDLLAEHPLWWNGPSWLTDSPIPWPTAPEELIISSPIEEKNAKIGLSTNTVVYAESPEKNIWDLGFRFSSLSKLLRVSAYVLRYVAKLTRRVHAKNIVNSRFKFYKFLDISVVGESQYLCSKELYNSKLLWIFHNQQNYFEKEISMLKKPPKDGKIKFKGPLAKLNPNLRQDFLRVGGRLDQSLLQYDKKHPFILPGDCFFSQLLARDAHSRTLHGGVQLTLATLRQEFWLINGRQTVKMVLRECKPCVRYAARLQNQIMGDLPPERVSPAAPFTRTGVDYAGPFDIRLTKTRGKGTLKGYVCLFKCMVTRGIHLELVEDYTSEAFIAAFHRFTARRGHCAQLISDNGPNFVGADAELQRMFRKGSEFLKQICPYLELRGTQWKWNPPGAPHFGGFWESGVKSTKHHIRRVVGESVLTFSEMSTLLSRIEACLNSRPLLPLTDDPTDINFLTPAHFLINKSSYLVPEQDFTDENIPVGRRWQIISQKMQHFWTRWQNEYLSSLQPRTKWTKKTRSFQTGDVVFIRQDNMPPGQWPLARVTDTFPDKHGINRVCELKTAPKPGGPRPRTRSLKPSVKLVLLLPVEKQKTTPAILEAPASSLVLLQAAA